MKKPPVNGQTDNEYGDIPNGFRKKPLFDELSIPFIDASPTPSPKPGRSTDR